MIRRSPTGSKMSSKHVTLCVFLLLMCTLRNTWARDLDNTARETHRIVERSTGEDLGEDEVGNMMEDIEHEITKRSADEFGDEDEEMEADKRGPQLSINQDMAALAAGMREGENRDRAIQSLYRLGKRGAGVVPYLSFAEPIRVHAQTLQNQRVQRSLGLLKRLGKRAAPQLSINQDLMALADAVRAQESSNALYRLGKRAPRLSINSELHALADSFRGGNRYRAQNTLASLGKRGPALSVNADLQALADSVYGSGPSQEESLSKLMRLGKRGRPLSVNADLVALADSFRNNQNTKTQNAANTLMRLGKRTPSFSFNQDLRTLADTYRESNGARGGAAQAQSTLQRIGRAAEH